MHHDLKAVIKTRSIDQQQKISIRNSGLNVGKMSELLNILRRKQRSLLEDS